MKLSVKGEYAFLAILDLALHAPGTPIRIADIAKRQTIPQKFLELILSGLKQGGFVESRRGAEGGYFLAKPANAITVGQVLRFVEGVRPATNGVRKKPGGPFLDFWQKVDDAVSEVVDKTTFADLARQWHERNRSYVPNWDI